MQTAQQIAKNLFYSDVEIVPTSSLIPFKTVDSKSHMVIVKSGQDGQQFLVNNCSENYGLIKNAEIFPLIENELDVLGFKYEAQYHTRNLSKFNVSYNITEGLDMNFKEMLGTDKTLFQLNFSNSYDSSTLFKESFGLFRRVCNNGMWGLGNEGGQSYSHSADVVRKILTQLDTKIQSYVTKIEEQASTIEKLAKIQIKESQLEERILEVGGLAGFYKSYNDEIRDRILLEKRQNKFKLNHWLLYNGFNFVLNHEQSISADLESKMKKDQRVYQILTDYN